MVNSLRDEFTAFATPEFKAIVDRIDTVIQESGLGLTRAIKWGQLAYANGGDFHHWICGIKITKNFVGLSFHFGGLLTDPDQIFIVGTSKFVRKIEYRRIDEIDGKIILGFIGQALDKLEYFKANWREIQQAG